MTGDTSSSESVVLDLESNSNSVYDKRSSVKKVFNATIGKGIGKIIAFLTKYGPSYFVLAAAFGLVSYWTIFTIVTLFAKEINNYIQVNFVNTPAEVVESFGYIDRALSAIVVTFDHYIDVTTIWGRLLFTLAINRLLQPIRFWLIILVLKPVAPILDPKLKGFYSTLSKKVRSLRHSYSGTLKTG